MPTVDQSVTRFIKRNITYKRENVKMSLGASEAISVDETVLYEDGAENELHAVAV